MDTKKKVANRIKEARKARGLTQEDLSDAIKRSVETISSLERGKSFPSVETFERLSSALGVPIRDFFDFEDGSMSKGKSDRDELIFKAVNALQSLPDSDLHIALDQIKALAKRSS